MKDNVVLSLIECSKQYPGVKALDNVSLDIREGEIHALVGENGAGKSTLIKCLSGAVVLDAGKIVFQGDEYTKMTPHMSKSLGISVIYQELNLIGPLSVAENVCYGDERGWLVKHSELEKRAAEVFARMEVNMDLKEQVYNLSIAQQQLVEIAKSLSREVKLLVMDEPTAPLTEDETVMLFKIMRRLKAEGVTIIYISHRMDEIFTICDRVSVMRDGSLITTKNVAETTRGELIEYMVGRSLNETFPQRSNICSENALEIVDLCVTGDENISLNVKKGEIVGIAGLVGSGRTELLRAVFGADKKKSGEVYVNGKKVDITSPSKAIKAGIGLIPEDRKNQGCFLYAAIDWNITIAALKKFARHGVLKFPEMHETAEEYSSKLKIKTPSLQQICSNLSGGNQQKVVLAKTLATDCDVILFDEPTRGIDVGAKQEIYQLMTELADSGKAILMVTSDMEELLGMSDRIYVLAEGELMGELDGHNVSQVRLMQLMSGEK